MVHLWCDIIVSMTDFQTNLYFCDVLLLIDAISAALTWILEDVGACLQMTREKNPTVIGYIEKLVCIRGYRVCVFKVSNTGFLESVIRVICWKNAGK